MKRSPAQVRRKRSPKSWKDHAIRQLQFVLDLAVLVLAFLLAYLLRFDFDIPSEFRVHLWTQLPYVVALQFAMLFATGIYSFVWRFIGLAEISAFLRAAAYSAAPLLVLRFGLPEAYRAWQVPLSIILIDTLLAFGGLLGLRIARRVIYEQERRRRHAEGHAGEERKRVLLIGAGQGGIVAAREIHGRGGLGLTVEGFIDDDPLKAGSIIQGLRVLGTTDDLPRIVAEHQIDHVILTIAEASRDDLRRIIGICETVPVRVRVIPGLFEVLEGRVEIQRVRDVQIEDLLGREPVELEEEAIAELLGGKRLLVTGAGGSIGSELARQALRFDPARAVLVDRSEYALFELERRIRADWPSGPVETVLADVSDAARSEELLARWRPEVILHAAAHKHVPMLEYHPAEAIRNNSLATAELGRLAGEAGVGTFVLVSTDKAVRPTSIMGASKRVAEIVVQSLSRRYAETDYLAVRFGNVLGSTGSVIPIFREQIADGGPVTVTHPAVKRYFMTPSEAAQLVLQAGAIGRSGEILVLDMGEPVSIADLARDMIRLSGFKPFEDIDIVYTGLRPGEKLYEELEISGESIERTRHPKIFVGRLEGYPQERVEFALRRLRELVDRGQAEAIRSFLVELLPESDLSLGAPAALGAPAETSTGARPNS